MFVGSTECREGGDSDLVIFTYLTIGIYREVKCWQIALERKFMDLRDDK